ncbi:hypothetical protein QBC44DRAFT_15694 [Cladorrhinum sp. PSN332]|nr:hypothetical protein QBC44DRAFT_15694 [Cladorrhinum sp. PSN332]
MKLAIGQALVATVLGATIKRLDHAENPHHLVNGLRVSKIRHPPLDPRGDTLRTIQVSAHTMSSYWSSCLVDTGLRQKRYCRTGVQEDGNGVGSVFAVEQVGGEPKIDSPTNPSIQRRSLAGKQRSI